MKVAIASHDPALVESLRLIVENAAAQHDLLWIASDAAAAARRCTMQRPDVLLLDLATSGPSVVEATRAIMDATPCGILILTASVERDSARVFAAMGAGALDVVAVPPQQRKGKALATQILQKIRIAGMLSPSHQSAAIAPRASQRPNLAVVAIGASAGGPPAVAEVLRDLPADLPAAIVVVQHVDAQFSEAMADWFATQTKLEVRIARDNERLQAGVVYLAAGEQHLVVTEAGVLAYSQKSPRSPYCPSADVLLESIARNWRGTAIGIILSGMGADGAAGLRKLRETGARTIAQDESTSAVYGMPRAAAELLATTDVLPLPAIGPLVRELLQPRGLRRVVTAAPRR